MSVIIPPGFGEAAIYTVGTEGTAPYITTIGVDLSDVGGDFVNAANAIMSSYTASFGGGLAADLSVTKVSLAVGQDGGSAPSVDSDLDPFQGGATGSFAPVAMACIMAKRTALLGREGRGRMFMPGFITDADVDEGGILRDTFIGDFLVAGAAFVQALQLGGPSPFPATPPVLLHSSATAPTEISQLVPVPKVGWIRKRLR